MTTTLTPYLKLRVNSALTADAKANLNKIDTLGAAFATDASSNTLFRSAGDIYLLPDNPSVGGQGLGGSLFMGGSSQLMDSLTIYTEATSITSPLGTLDQGTGGNKYLRIKYDSTLTGAVDTVADRILSIDLEGSNRSLILGTDLSISAANLTLGLISYTLPSTSATLVDLDDPQTLINKSLSGLTNTFTNIAYSSLVLSNSIVNADIAASAAIAYSKLNLANSILNADVAPSAAIAYSKLNLSASIVNGDVSASAAIDGSKVVPDFASQDVRTQGELQVARNSSIASKFVASASQAADITYTLPAAAPTTNQVLRYTGSVLEWASVGSGTVTSIDVAVSGDLNNILDVSGGPVTASGTITLDLDTQAANTVLVGPSTGSPAKPQFRALVANDIPTLTTSKISDFNTAWDTRLGTKSTSDLAEGTNLYYTDTRFDNRLATKTTTDLTEGSNLYYTNARADARIDLRKYVTTWAPGDGTSKAITHGLGTTEVSWNIYDIDSGEEIWPNTAIRTSTTAMSFTSNEAPTGSGWRIIVRS